MGDNQESPRYKAGFKSLCHLNHKMITLFQQKMKTKSVGVIKRLGMHIISNKRNLPSIFKIAATICHCELAIHHASSLTDLSIFSIRLNTI